MKQQLRQLSSCLPCSFNFIFSETSPTKCTSCGFFCFVGGAVILFPVFFQRVHVHTAAGTVDTVGPPGETPVKRPPDCFNSSSPSAAFITQPNSKPSSVADGKVAHKPMYFKLKLNAYIIVVLRFCITQTWKLLNTVLKMEAVGLSFSELCIKRSANRDSSIRIPCQCTPYQRPLLISDRFGSCGGEPQMQKN